MGACDWIDRARFPAHVLLLVLIAFAAASAAFGFVPTAAQNVVLTAAYTGGAVPLDPQAVKWFDAPALTVPLSGQIMLPPRGGGTVTTANVRALVNRSAIAILAEWHDPTKDVQLVRTEDFSDAFAVQIVDAGGKSAPFVCMGQTDFQTQIWQWRADRDPFAGGGLRLEDVYPDIYADYYPFVNESTFYPALDAGNIMVRQNETPVQVLVAGGAGTIAPAGTATVYGAGTWSDNTWKIVFSRKLEPASSAEVALRNGARFAISFAAWDGASGERDGMKSTSNWVDLDVQATSWFDVELLRPVVLAAFAFIILLVLIAAFRRRKKETEALERRPQYSSQDLEKMLAPEKEGRTRREFLGLLVPGAAGAGVSLVSGRAGGAVARATAEGEEETAAWEERRARMMAEFEEGYRKPKHLR